MGTGCITVDFSCCYSAESHMAIAVADSPLGPFVKYEKNPIYCKNNELIGTGHHSFCKTSDPNRFIAAFHCHSGKTDSFIPRMVCLTEAKFIPQSEREDRPAMGND